MAFAPAALSEGRGLLESIKDPILSVLSSTTLGNVPPPAIVGTLTNISAGAHELAQHLLPVYLGFPSLSKGHSQLLFSGTFFDFSFVFTLLVKTCL